jgi:rare lipoprotein A
MMKWLTALSGAFSAVRSAAAFPVRTAFGRAVAVSGVCALALAGCNAVTTSDGGGGDGINDAALGVAASPRVTDQETNLPRGGGRAQVGRPYRIAGRLYTPREDPNYDRTGIASWYGPGFHGRLTANGEVFDQYTLSAAHPTLPLPSYVRVTNLENDRSVMVRVNDRGPFAHDRIIDLSKRAADVLAFRGDGIARVRVEYEGRAPLHGQDVAWLEASAEINGRPINGGDPNIMLARAPVPAPTPAAAPAQAAFVATSGAAPVPQQGVPQRASFLDTLFGQPQQPQVQRAPAITPAVAPAGSPMVLAPPSGSQAAVTPAFAPAQSQPAASLVPNAPIPSAAIGFMATDLETGFTQRNQSSLAQTARIELAHRAATSNALDAASRMALQSQAIARLSEVQNAPVLALAPTESTPIGRTALIQIGIFGDPANVARLRSELSNLGEVVTQPIQSRGRELTQVRLRASAPTRQAEEELLRRLASQGYTDAYVTDANG